MGGSERILRRLLVDAERPFKMVHGNLNGKKKNIIGGGRKTNTLDTPYLIAESLATLSMP